MSRITADVRTSPPADWKPVGLISTPELWVAYNAARNRYSSLKSGKNVEKKPLEFETTAFWEDLYHKVLLPGYSNNSQQPPNDTSDKRCDIVTRYFDDNSQRRTLIFTEAKRASQAFETDGIKKMEEQVLGYCQEYLMAKDSQPTVYACTVVGPYIRCFRVSKGQKLVGLWPGKLTRLESYLDPYDQVQAAVIQRAFHDMTVKTPPSKMSVLSDHASGSYRSSPPGRVSPSGSSSSSGKGSSPERHLPHLPSLPGPPSSEQGSERRDGSLSTRSMSPARSSPGPSGLQGQSSPLSYRQRSPPQGPRRPLPAVALVKSWGRDFNSTNFLVQVEGSGESFHRLGEEFKRGTVQDRSGRDVPCYFTSHNSSSIYVLSLDPKTIQRTRDTAKDSLPKWAKK